MKKYAVIYLALAMLVSVVNTTPIYADSVVKQTTKATETEREEVVPQTLSEKLNEKIKMIAPMLGAQSIQYVLIEDGEIVASGDTSYTTDTLYGVGSVSKMYTTLAVMQLVEEGKVNLDSPLITYIPEFKMADERYKDITPRMLLNHSSGMMGTSAKNMMLFEDNDDYATTNLLEVLKTQRLKADPGAYSVYCNDGFTLAEILVEHVSGMSFTDYIRTYITQPLGVESTVTPQEDWGDKKVAPFYNANGVQQPTEVVNQIGTGGIYATAKDVAKLGEIYLGSKEDILSQEMVALTMAPEYQKGMWPEGGDNALAFGLGWDHMNAYPFSDYDIQALVKGGDTLSYHASLIVLPEENMVAAVLSSGGLSTYNHMIGTDMIIERLIEKGVIQERLPVHNFGIPEKVIPATKEEVVKSGKYGTMGAMLDIAILPEGQLNLSFVGMPELGVQSFIHTGEGKYLSPDGTTQVSIVEEVNKGLYLKVEQYVNVPGIGALAVCEYQGQKIEENVLEAKVEKVWKAREGKKYYVLDEKYSSVGHTREQSLVIKLQEEVPGYVLNMMITSENEAKNMLQIPGNYGRDVSDIKFVEVDGVEYLQVGSFIAISEDEIPNLEITGKQTVVIEKDEYAKWYTIKETDANKYIEIKAPKNGSFAVYDAEGSLVTFSRVSNRDQVKLPAGGSIMFAGDAGVVFELEEIEVMELTPLQPANE